MKTIGEIESTLIELVAELAFKKVSISDELILSGILDSMSIVELVHELEEIYKIKIPLEQLKALEISNLGELANLIMEKL